MINGLRGGNLIRNQNLENRVQYMENKIKTLQTMGRDPRNYIIIVLQYFHELEWKNTCIVGSKDWTINKLKTYVKKQKQNPGEITELAAPKNGVMIQSNKMLSDVYDLYHDRDDKLLYIKLLTDNVFGFSFFKQPYQ